MISIEEIKSKYFEKNGENLDTVLSGTANAERYIKRVQMLIEEDIKDKNPNYLTLKQTDKLYDFQKDAIIEAILEQIDYMMNVGDFTQVSGYDPITNSIADNKQLKKRHISALAKQILDNAGLYYSGIKSYSSRRLY